MKQWIFIPICLAFVILALKCKSGSTEPIRSCVDTTLSTTALNTTLPQHKVVVALVVDNSLSYTNTIRLTDDVIFNLIQKVATTAGDLILISLDSNSNEPVYKITIDKVDTVNTTGISNIYTRRKTERANQQKLVGYSVRLRQQAQAFITELHSHPPARFSDVQRSLDLCKVVSEPNYETGFTKWVIALTDFVNELPHHRYAPLRPVSLRNSIVLAVRPSATISDDSLHSLFPGAQVFSITTPDNAIALIK